MLDSSMAKTTSLILGPHFEAYIQQKIESGAYATAAEVIREALRDHEREDQKARELDSELDKALASGRAKPGVWKRLKTKHGIK